MYFKLQIIDKTIEIFLINGNQNFGSRHYGFELKNFGKN